MIKLLTAILLFTGLATSQVKLPNFLILGDLTSPPDCPGCSAQAPVLDGIPMAPPIAPPFYSTPITGVSWEVQDSVYLELNSLDIVPVTGTCHEVENSCIENRSCIFPLVFTFTLYSMVIPVVPPNDIQVGGIYLDYIGVDPDGFPQYTLSKVVMPGCGKGDIVTFGSDIWEVVFTDSEGYSSIAIPSHTEQHDVAVSCDICGAQ